MKGKKLILPACRTIGNIFREKDGTKSLATAAHVYLDFLLLTKSEWQVWNKRTSEIASERYLAFSKLQQEAYPDAVPTRDISIAWCADMLDRPHAAPDTLSASVAEDEALSGGKSSNRQWYYHQQIRILQAGKFRLVVPTESGGLLKTPLTRYSWFMIWGGMRMLGLTVAKGDVAAAKTPSIASFDYNNEKCITEERRESILQPWKAKYDTTAALWEQWTNTKYRLAENSSYQLESHRPVPPKEGETDSTADKYLAKLRDVDLVSCDAIHRREAIAQAIESQSPFVSKILNRRPSLSGWRNTTHSEAFVRLAVTRYVLFLNLARDRDDSFMLVPTLDIDLVWHAHMLSPADYERDTLAICGKVLSHRQHQHVSLERLQEGRRKTRQLWQDTYPHYSYEMSDEPCESQQERFSNVNASLMMDDVEEDIPRAQNHSTQEGLEHNGSEDGLVEDIIAEDAACHDGNTWVENEMQDLSQPHVWQNDDFWEGPVKEVSWAEENTSDSSGDSSDSAVGGGSDDGGGEGGCGGCGGCGD